METGPLSPATASLPPKPPPWRRTRRILFVVAIVAGLALGGGAAFAVHSLQQRDEPSQGEDVDSLVAAFSTQLGFTNAAFTSLDAHIVDGSDLLDAVDQKRVEATLLADLEDALAQAQGFVAETSQYSETTTGLESADIEAATASLAELADAADQLSVDISDATAEVFDDAQTSASADLAKAVKKLKAERKSGRALLESSEGRVLDEEPRTILARDLEQADGTLKQEVSDTDLADVYAATKAHRKVTKQLTKSQDLVEEAIAAYEAELAAQVLPPPPAAPVPLPAPTSERPEPEPTTTKTPKPPRVTTPPADPAPDGSEAEDEPAADPDDD